MKSPSRLKSIVGLAITIIIAAAAMADLLAANTSAEEVPLNVKMRLAASGGPMVNELFGGYTPFRHHDPALRRAYSKASGSPIFTHPDSGGTSIVEPSATFTVTKTADTTTAFAIPTVRCAKPWMSRTVTAR